MYLYVFANASSVLENLSALLAYRSSLCACVLIAQCIMQDACSSWKAWLEWRTAEGGFDRSSFEAAMPAGLTVPVRASSRFSYNSTYLYVFSWFRSLPVCLGGTVWKRAVTARSQTRWTLCALPARVRRSTSRFSLNHAHSWCIYSTAA